MTKRFYVQYTASDPLFETRWQNCWQVFDRSRTRPAGDVQAIALCIDIETAKMIRDAMNERDEILPSDHVPPLTHD